ncbi:hypothetical protein, partial [Rhodanobacter lindaniclasticus]
MPGAVQRRFLRELTAGHKALRGAKQYDEDVQALNATRQQLLARAPDADEHPDDMLKRGGAAIADDLRAYAHVKGPGGWLGAKTEAGRTLAGVMHDATILGIDPSEAYEPLKMQKQPRRVGDLDPGAGQTAHCRTEGGDAGSAGRRQAGDDGGDQDAAQPEVPREGTHQGL